MLRIDTNRQNRNRSDLLLSQRVIKGCVGVRGPQKLSEKATSTSYHLCNWKVCNVLQEAINRNPAENSIDLRFLRLFILHFENKTVIGEVAEQLLPFGFVGQHVTIFLIVDRRVILPIGCVLARVAFEVP